MTTRSSAAAAVDAAFLLIDQYIADLHRVRAAPPIGTISGYRTRVAAVITTLLTEQQTRVDEAGGYGAVELAALRSVFHAKK